MTTAKRLKDWMAECAAGKKIASLEVAGLIADAHQEIEQYERDETTQLAAIKLLRDKLALILPLAKGYAAEHPVGSNGAYVGAAERAIDSTENFIEEVADTDRRFRQR